MGWPQAGWITFRSKRHPVLFTPLHLTIPKPLNVQLGASLTTVLKTGKQNRQSLYQLPVRIRIDQTSRIHVGPFIGILTSDGKRAFRGNPKNFADLIRMGRKMGVSIFVVTPQSFQKQNDFVLGYLLDPRSQKNRWIKARLPFPQVIYNRIPDRIAEKRVGEQAILRRLKESPNVHLFNDRFFNKRNLYQYLLSSEEWRHMVPKTKPLHHIDQLKTMLSQHPTLYVKPIDGKAGINLMRITKINQTYTLTTQTQKGCRHYHQKSINDLWKLICEKRKNHDYVIQQGIPLAKYQNRPCDFRALIQKDHLGKWKVTGIGVRVAGKQAISTHVPMGGHIANVHRVLKTLFPDNHTYIYQKMSQKTNELAKFIEKSYDRPLGEMSMDIGVESNGRMWFFEANAKPMKFDEPEIRKLSLQRIIQYSLFLSGFVKPSGGRKK